MPPAAAGGVLTIPQVRADARNLLASYIEPANRGGLSKTSGHPTALHGGDNVAPVRGGRQRFFDDG